MRLWLRGMGISEDEVNDIVQDSYVLIAHLDSVAHIRNGKSYFFQTAKSVFIRKIRRARIVPIGQLTELDSAALSDDDPGPERRVSARQELERVRRLIAGLPDKCRTIFEMRRLQGLPQKEIARRLGVSENIVEMQAVRGLKLILKALERNDNGDGDTKKRKTETRFEVEENG